jgi:biotin carboxyl carrier protein
MPSYRINGKDYHIDQVTTEGSKAAIILDRKKIEIELLSDFSGNGSPTIVRIGSRVFNAEAFTDKDGKLVVIVNRKLFQVEEMESETQTKIQTDAEDQGPSVIYSPMSGRIVSLKKHLGDSVKRSESILVLEAMKMENEVSSTKSGIVKELNVQQGELVKAGDKLAVIE